MIHTTNIFLFGISVMIFISGCSELEPPSSPDVEEWLIPKYRVEEGAGRDQIPSIDNPKFVNASEVDYVKDDQLVIGVKVGDQVKLYPHFILNYHEIINDRINEVPIAMTFCPLTGTAICWNREIKDTTFTFGVSGFLYKNNLIPFNRVDQDNNKEAESEWSQMLLAGVSGKFEGTKFNHIEVVESTWKTWKKAYPNAQFLSIETGHVFPYNRNPYGDYPSDHDQFVFPRDNIDDRLQPKTRVHGIILGDPVKNFSKDKNHSTAVVKAYPIHQFDSTLTILNETVNGEPIVVYGSRDDNIMQSFKRAFDGTELNFEAVNDAYPVVMKDQQGNKWNIFGEAVEGPLEGQQLQSTNSYTGYWFAWTDFYPNIDIYGR